MKRWKQSSERCQEGSSSSKDQRTKKHVGRSLTSCSEGSSEVRGKSYYYKCQDLSDAITTVAGHFTRPTATANETALGLFVAEI